MENTNSIIGIKVNKTSIPAKCILLIRKYNNLPISEIKQKIENNQYILICDYVDENGIKSILGLYNELKSEGVNCSLYEHNDPTDIEFLHNLLDSYEGTRKQVEENIEREIQTEYSDIIKIFRCDKVGEIHTISLNEYPYDYSPAQFCIVKKYEFLYKKELKRFKDLENTPYALPGINKKIQMYNGIDREPLAFTPNDMDEYSVNTVLEYYHKLNNKNLDLIFYRMNGYVENVPKNLKFIGFDIGYLYGKGDGDGFSIICDCMFLSRWHGCDEKGIEFDKEFHQLNKDGLFESKEDAVKYLYHYLHQEWAETGDFCVFEIYVPL